MRRPPSASVAVSALGIVVCITGIVYLVTLFPRTYGYAVNADKDHVSAFASVLAAIAAFVGALIGAVTNLINALGQRSLEVMKLDLQKDLESHKVSLSQAAMRTTAASQVLVQLLGAMAEYRDLLSLIEVGAFGAPEAALAEAGFRGVRRQLTFVDEPIREAVLDFLSAGENIRGKIRTDPNVNQHAVWVEGIKEFGGAFESARSEVRAAYDALFAASSNKA